MRTADLGIVHLRIGLTYVHMLMLKTT